MHAWIKGSMSIPLKGAKKAKIGTMEITGHFGVYARVGCHSDFVEFLEELSAGASDVQTLAETFEAMAANGKVQVFGNLALVLTLDLKKLVGLPIPEFKV